MPPLRPDLRQRAPTLTTPLLWAAGGGLLTVSVWLPGMVALVRSFLGLFQ